MIPPPTPDEEPCNCGGAWHRVGDHPDHELPPFAYIRVRAYVQLGDVEDLLRSDWAPGTGPTRGQGHALHEAVLAIARAKAALNEAAR